MKQEELIGENQNDITKAVTGKILNADKINNWPGNNLQEIYKESDSSIVFRLRDNQNERNRFAFLFLQRDGNLIQNASYTVVSSSAMGQMTPLCGELTNKETEQIQYILSQAVASNQL